MRTTTNRTAAGLLVAAAALALSGCFGLDGRPIAASSGPAETPRTAPPEDAGPAARERAQADAATQVQADWETITGSGKYILPSGYDWPETAPTGISMTQGFTLDAEGVAERTWGCLTLDAAWRLADAGDRPAGDALLQTIFDESNLMDSDPPNLNPGPYSHDWGWAGICTLALDAIDYSGSHLVRGYALKQSTAQDVERIYTHALCEGTLVRYDLTKPDGGDWRWEVSGGQVKDTGTAAYASGTPSADLASYTVAAGDTWVGIGDRFCIDHYLIGMVNRDLVSPVDGLQSGQTIRLKPADNAQRIAALWGVPLAP